MRSLLRKWWWVPLIVFGGLILKTWLVGGALQGKARELAADAAGVPIDRVEISDGFDVRMTGFTDDATRDRAVAAVDELDSSWDVVGVVDQAAAPAVVDPEEPAESDESDESDAEAEEAEAAPVVGAEPAAVDIAVDADAVVLTGVVPSEDVRAGLVAQAIAGFGEANVTDRLVVDSTAVAPDGGTITVTGEAANEGQRQDWLAGPTSAAGTTGFRLIDETTVASPSVEEQLNALFELEPIEFDTSRATIRSNSEATLDAAATVITDNPDAGQLLVVGHTDSVGAEGPNQSLSQRRAEAVVDYLVEVGGVDATRLEAQGRGESELKIDPEVTAEDKQRNRRIEWELIGS